MKRLLLACIAVVWIESPLNSFAQQTSPPRPLNVVTDLTAAGVQDQMGAVLNQLAIVRTERQCKTFISLQGASVEICNDVPNVRENPFQTFDRLKTAKQFSFYYPKAWGDFQAQRQTGFWMPEDAVEGSRNIIQGLYSVVEKGGRLSCQGFSEHRQECLTVWPTITAGEKEPNGLSFCQSISETRGPPGFPPDARGRPIDCEPVVMSFGRERFLRVSASSVAVAPGYRDNAIVFQYRLITPNNAHLNPTDRMVEWLDEADKNAQVSPLHLQVDRNTASNVLYAFTGKWRNSQRFKLWEDINVTLTAKTERATSLGPPRSEYLSIVITGRLMVLVVEESVDDPTKFHPPDTEKRRIYEKDVIATVTEGARQACGRLFQDKATFKENYGATIDLECRAP